MLEVCGIAFTFSAAKTVFTGSKTAYDLASKACGAPHDLAALRDALRMLKRPIALCADLGTRHKFADVMAPALMMCRRLEVDSAELLAHTPKDEMGWKAWLDLQIGVEGATRASKLKGLLSQSSLCFKALTLALTSAAAIAGRPVAQSRQLSWEIDHDAHTLAYDLFFRKLQVGECPAGVIGVGKLHVQSDSNPGLLVEWPPPTQENKSMPCSLKLVANADGGSGLSHTIEFALVGGGDHPPGGACAPFPITKDTQFARRALVSTGVQPDHADESRVAFELLAAVPRTAEGVPSVRRVVFVPECALGVCDVDPDDDDDHKEPFALSAELFEAAVALAVYTAGNRATKGPNFAGDDAIDLVGSPQRAAEPAWVDWYTQNFLGGLDRAPPPPGLDGGE